MEKTVYIIRHGEKPLEHTDHGLTEQGGIRAYYLPVFIGGLFEEGRPFELYTYSGSKKEAKSRAYYTVQRLQPDHKIVYDNVVDYDKVIEDALESKYNNIVICWEHKAIMEMLSEFTDKNFTIDNFNHDVQKIGNAVRESALLQQSITVPSAVLSDITLGRDQEPLAINDELVANDIEFSLLWTLKFGICCGDHVFKSGTVSFAYSVEKHDDQNWVISTARSIGFPLSNIIN